MCRCWWTLGPGDTCRQIVLLSMLLICDTVIDFSRFALTRAYSKLYVVNFVETVNCGLLSITHLEFGILRFSIDIFDKTFEVGLLMKVWYPKRSSSPLSNFLSDLINGAYLFGNLVLIIQSDPGYLVILRPVILTVFVMLRVVSFPFLQCSCFSFLNSQTSRKVDFENTIYRLKFWKWCHFMIFL